MPMNDDAMVRIMETLGLDYGPAIQSTKAFENRIAALNKQLFAMKALAIQGAKDINNAFSSTLGVLGGNKTILDQYGQPLSTIKAEATKVGTGIADSFKPATEELKRHKQTVQDVGKQYNIFGSEMQRRVSWFLSGALFYGSAKAAKEAIQTISEVEMGMVEIARVMEDSTFKFKEYRDELLQLGVDYGQSFEVVQDIALRWAQAGYGVRDSLELTKTALLALNTAELDAKNATESMIGIMAQWKMEVADLPLLMDKINKTADDFTITSQDLVDGLLRSSSAARIMNLSIDETIALLTVMREASGRTGREVGNALNSILSYVQRPSSIKVLESMGIQVFADEARTQFRNVMRIFEDVAAKWNTVSADIQDSFVKSADEAGLFNEELATALGLQEQWNDLQQRDIAQASAGVYRRNYYIGMIERLSEAQEVLNGLTDAAGYSQAENTRTMDTLEKKYQSLKTAAEQLAVALGDAGLLDTLKGIVDGATNATNAIAKLNPEMKALLTTALEIIGISAALKGVMGMFTSRSMLFGAEALLPGWSKLLVLIPAIVSGLALLSHNYKNVTDGTVALKRKQDDLINSYNSQIEAADNSQTSLLGEAKAAEALADKLQELTEKEKLNVAEKAQLKTIVDQLNTALPNLNLKIDEQTGKIVGNTQAIRDNIQALKDQALAQAYQAKASAAAEAYVNQELLVGETKNQLDATRAELTSLMNHPLLREIQKIRDDTSLGAHERGRAIASLNQKYGFTNIEQRIRDLQTEISGLDTLLNKQITELDKREQELDEYTNMAVQLRTSESTVQMYKDGKIITVRQSEISSYLQTGWRLYTPSPTGGASATEIDSGGTGVYSNTALQNALRLLEHKKRLNRISTEDEIVTLNNILQAHVKTSDERMDIIERIYDAEQRLIKETEEKHNKALEEQKKKRAEFLNYYKQSISEIQDEIRYTYDERVRLIDEEIDKIDEQIKQINRSEDAREHKNTIRDLKDELAYWSVRTSEEARRKVKEINEKIAEEQHKRAIELQKQELEDKKDILEDEKKQWKSALDDMLEAFKGNNADIVASARINSKAAFDEWYDNYILPMQEALESGNLSDFQSGASRIGGSISQLPSHDWGMTDADYQEFIANGMKWQELRAAGASIEELKAINAKNDALRRKYGRDPALGEYPKFHGGGKALTDGIAELKKGEIVFPPNLSAVLERLILTLRTTPSQSVSTSTISNDNRRDIKIDKLLNIEHNIVEDNTDTYVMTRELQRAITAL